MTNRNSIHWGLFALLFFCVAYAHQKKFDAPTAVSRLDLLHALVVEGRFEINSYQSNTPDKAEWMGGYYSDKAPGTSALALAPFALSASVLGACGVNLNSDAGWLFSSWLACALSIGIVTALGGVALFAWLSRYVSSRTALVTTLGLFLGAAPLPYATMMFSHALVVGLMAIAIWAIEKGKEMEAHKSHSLAGLYDGGLGRWFSSNRWDLLAGSACGWALASEYSSGLMAAGIAFWLVLMNWRRLPAFALAATGPLLLIPAYHWVCFGDPFTLAYSHQASFPAMREGVYAIKWPDADTAFKLLFSPARGLLFWTPFLAMAGFGYWKLIGDSPRLFWLTYALPLLQIVVISGRTWDWPAGPTLGPRLLAPMLPWLALPCAYGVWRFPKLGMVLAAYSISITTLATLTDACPSFNAHPNPLMGLHWPLFLKGAFGPNLGKVFGLPPYISILAYYGVLICGTAWLWRGLGRDAEKPRVKRLATEDVSNAEAARA